MSMELIECTTTSLQYHRGVRRVRAVEPCVLFLQSSNRIVLATFMTTYPIQSSTQPTFGEFEFEFEFESIKHLSSASVSVHGYSIQQPRDQRSGWPRVRVVRRRRCRNE